MGRSSQSGREDAFTFSYSTHSLHDGDLFLAKARRATRARRDRAFQDETRTEDLPGMGYGYPELDEVIEERGINLDRIHT